ncbi:S41 family peptidase [Geotalea sp. SG265]|uniref:S41 family peptidase n=1 Tax=Geotalea sp. SG265 TaxID=2922867 RepID=UPI001FAF9782|nr:S41 family peptidase [Geotalea sp. SG265]
MGRSRKIILSLFLIIVILSAAIFGILNTRKSISQRSDQDYLRLFTEVVAIIKRHYVEEVDTRKLMQSAVRGMLTSLDPHSEYMAQESFKEMQVHIAGSFGGLGIEINMQDGKLVVVSPIEDTPAFKAGIKPGDHIWKIDDKFTRGMNISKAVSLMRGEKGTSVTLTILRNGSSTPLVFHLVRDIIKTRSVKARTLEPGFGYIGVAEFQGRTGEDFANALKKLREDNGGALRGLVLDLRYNPGGLVDQAFMVADRFIGEGLSNGLIVYTEGREPSAKRSWTAYVGEKEPRYPMVVLINGGSASASEIVAGALQDHKRAIIMGTQSFGKGSVQSVLPLRNGDGLKLTTAKYYTPNGRSIQAKGITPDIVVGMMKPKNGGVPDKDDSIREKDLENHFEEKGKAAEPQQEPKRGKTITAAAADRAKQDDYQLSRALDLLKGIDMLSQLKLKK